MAAMILELALLAAAAPNVPAASGAQAPSARAEGRVAVRIVSGARLAAGEQQDSALPPLSDSLVRTSGGGTAPARLVEFR